jgi:UDP-N-acetyl-2-amino-2-deoxyglucuronate dehydrogenase
VHAYQPITGRKIRVALVGCGRIWLNHVEALKKHHDHFEIVAVCDTDAGRLDEGRRLTGAPGFAIFDRLLDAVDSDLVVLATPSGLHANQAIVAARAGKHVLTEKPMATRWQDAKRWCAPATSAGVRLFVVKQNRRNSTLQLLKRAIDEDRFGRIFMTVINVFWTGRRNTTTARAGAARGSSTAAPS